MKTTGDMEDIYQNIGRSCVNLFGAAFDKTLIYAEVTSNVISASLFISQTPYSVRYIFCPKEIENLIYKLWESSEQQKVKHSWRCMSFVIYDRKFEVNFIYEEEINLEDSIIERRGLVLERQFPLAAIDYSQPEIDS